MGGQDVSPRSIGKDSTSLSRCEPGSLPTRLHKANHYLPMADYLRGGQRPALRGRPRARACVPSTGPRFCRQPVPPADGAHVRRQATGTRRERRLHCVVETLPRVVARLGGIGEIGLTGSGGRRVRRPQTGRRAGAPDVARRRADLAGPQCRHAAPSRCDGHEAGAAMAWSVVSQKLFDQTLPEPVGSK
jgi:hypothetical protein